MNAKREAFLKDEIAALRRRAESAEAELFRLREGKGWRQVTDDAPAPEEPHVIDTIRGMDLVRRDPDSRNIWHTVHGQRYYVDYEIRGWLKLPLALDATPADVSISEDEIPY